MHKFREYSSLIENTLARQDFDREPEELYQPLRYILALGGKRLRPALSLAACDLYGGSLSEALMPALGIELFHNFSLLHDDIMDQADLRRGKMTVHKKWDVNRAILSGDAMLVKAYQYIAQVEHSVLPKVLRCFSDTALGICEGQQMDMNFETRDAVSEEEYLEMIELKTAILLGAALKIGALVGGASGTAAQHLYRFGLSAGLAFQVQDDLLDAFGDPAKVGKQPGGDILQGKKTLLMIYAAEREPKKLAALAAQDYARPEDQVAAYVAFFEQSGVRQAVVAKRDALLAEALAALAEAQAKNAEVEQQLGEFARWLALREH